MPTTTKPQAVAYIRWSSEEQSHGDSEARQIDRAKEYAERHGFEIVKVIKDRGISAWRGRNITHGALGEFLRDVKAKRIKVDVLLVESVNRLSRQTPQKALMLFFDITESGIVIHSLIDGKVYENNADFVDLIHLVLSSGLSNKESNDKADLVGKAWATIRKNAARATVTARCPYWLSLPRLDPLLPKAEKEQQRKKRKFKINKERAAVIRQIFEWSAKGLGIYTITKRLNQTKTPTFGLAKCWVRSSVAKILLSRAVLGEYQPKKYIGEAKRKYIPDGKVIKSYYPRIISDDLFDRAEAQRSRRLNHLHPIGGRRGKSIFSGLIKCAYCGGSVYRQDKGNGYAYLVCDGARSGSQCQHRKGWRYSAFEDSFVSLVKDIDFSKIGQTDADGLKQRLLHNELTELEGKRATLELRQAKENELWESGQATNTPSSFVAKRLYELEQGIADITTRIEAKQKELIETTHDMRAVAENHKQIKPILDRLRDDPEAHEEATARLRSMVNCIYIAAKGWDKKSMNLDFMKGKYFRYGKDKQDKMLHWTMDQAPPLPLFMVDFKHAKKMLLVMPNRETNGYYCMEIDENGLTGEVEDAPFPRFS
jgi:DNA invertase Pin-like site-specific DNA recombinase